MNHSQRSTVVLAAARMSCLSYADKGDDDQSWEERVKHKLQSRGFRQVRCWIVDDVELVAATTHSFRFYAFRGSSSVQDWLSNIGTRQEAWYSNSAKVHRGFARNYRKILEAGSPDRSLERDLDRAREDGLSIACCGHSRGGAFATMMAAHQLANSRGIQALVTFGCPRVGNAAFADTVAMGIAMSGGEVIRLVNRCDPVPMLPMPWRYKHVGKPHYISGDGSLKVHPSFGWMLVDRLLTSYQRRGGEISAIRDHDKNAYLGIVKAKFKVN